MKKIRNIVLLALAICLSSLLNAQKQEAEILADEFWNYIKADSSAFVIKKAIGHADMDEYKLSETILLTAVSFGKPHQIDRKGYYTSPSTTGLMGKGQYICFEYRNKYKDDLLGESLVFEKLLFFRKIKTEPFKLVQYKWSRKGTDIDCD